jgi:hypothetical protein
VRYEWFVHETDIWTLLRKSVEDKAKIGGGSLTGTDGEALQVARAKLQEAMSVWMEARSVYMPLVPAVLDVSEQPEQDKLCLPSSLDHSSRVRLNLQDLAAIELRLRCGQANDALLGLRMALRRRSLLINVKHSVKGGSSQRIQTRSEARIAQATKSIKAHVATYTCTRQAMEQLGGPMTDYPGITNEDLSHKNIVNNLELGKGRKRLGWLWKGKFGGTTEEWGIEGGLVLDSWCCITDIAHSW